MSKKVVNLDEVKEEVVTVKEENLHEFIANLPEDRSDSFLGDKKAYILGIAFGTVAAGFGLWYSATLTKASNKIKMDKELNKYNKGSFRRLSERI